MKKSVAIGIIDTVVNRNVYGINNKIVKVDARYEHQLSSHPVRSSNHATFNAFLLAGKRQSEKDIILCPDTELYISGCLEGDQLGIDIMEGLSWLLEQPIDILLMPFGDKRASPFLIPFINQAVRKGILPIAAIGNEGAGKHCAPGYYQNVLSVGASDQQGKVLSLSGSRNLKDTTCVKPDLTAYGANLNDHLTEIKAERGTSVASTYVAGIAVKLMEKYPEASPDQIFEALVNSADDISENQNHRSKNGLVNYQKALNYLENPNRSISENLKEIPVEKYIDPTLIWHCNHNAPNEKNEAICIIDNRFKSSFEDLVDIKKSYLKDEIYHIECTVKTMLQLSNSPYVKVLQAIRLPMFVI